MWRSDAIIQRGAPVREHKTPEICLWTNSLKSDETATRSFMSFSTFHGDLCLYQKQHHKERFFFSNWSLTLHHSGPGFHSSVHSPVSPLWAPSPQTVCESSVEVLLERRPVPPDSAICWSTVQYSLLPYTNPFISPGSWQPAVKELTVWEVKGDRVWYTDTFTDRNWSQKPSKTSYLEKKPKSAFKCPSFFKHLFHFT